MIIEYIRYRLPSERCIEFGRAYGLAGEPLLASPHCLTYELTRCTEDSTSYLCGADRVGFGRRASAGVPREPGVPRLLPAIRRDLCDEARRLARMLATHPIGDVPAVH